MDIPILMTREEGAGDAIPLAYLEYAGGVEEMMLLDEKECPLECGERDEDCGETCVLPSWSEICEAKAYG